MGIGGISPTGGTGGTGGVAGLGGASGSQLSGGSTANPLGNAASIGRSGGGQGASGNQAFAELEKLIMQMLEQLLGDSGHGGDNGGQGGGPQGGGKAQHGGGSPHGGGGAQHGGAQHGGGSPQGSGGAQHGGGSPQGSGGAQHGGGTPQGSSGAQGGGGSPQGSSGAQGGSGGSQGPSAGGASGNSSGGGTEKLSSGNAQLGTVTGGTQSQQQAALKGNQDDINAYGKYYTAKSAAEVTHTTIGTPSGGAAGLTSMAGEGNSSQITVQANADGQNMTETEAHEFNHAHTSDNWSASSVGKDGNANEATTDWLAQQAAGGYSGGTVSGYQSNDDKVQQAVDQGLVSKDTIAKAYFSGDESAIQQVAAAYQKVGL